MSVGENVRRLRESKGISTHKLAKLVDVTQPMITHIERGRKIPSLSLAVDIAQALGCTLDELLGEDKK